MGCEGRRGRNEKEKGFVRGRGFARLASRLILAARLNPEAEVTP